MAPKKIAETVGSELNMLLDSATSDLRAFLAHAGPGALKLINAILVPIADGHGLVTMMDEDGNLLGFTLRPAHVQPSVDIVFLPGQGVPNTPKGGVALVHPWDEVDSKDTTEPV